MATKNERIRLISKLGPVASRCTHAMQSTLFMHYKADALRAIRFSRFIELFMVSTFCNRMASINVRINLLRMSLYNTEAIGIGNRAIHDFFLLCQYNLCADFECREEEKVFGIDR